MSAGDHNVYRAVLEQYVIRAADKARRLRAKACKADGIDPSQTFVVFSDGNPHKAAYSKAAAALLAAGKELADFCQKEGYPPHRRFHRPTGRQPPKEVSRRCPLPRRPSALHCGEAI